ncbi:uncharacterized protein LOC107721013 [Sinocyclocheilus rhinocerous]|uniref:uncharacterized protein LOC107721013 n=1 Tax=Sinocyclocheilus rhinocerous TaxID=307959 RepID=UPI0007B7BBC5|nr:PREDICTED: uncharacterized protein LOC107721013 [Sinocyclocheilus rhinocerous]
MTLLRHQELAPVLLGYLKQRHASGSPCGSDTSSLSAWLEESFGKFSIYVDYKDLREINTGFDSFEALDILSTSQVAELTLESGALNSAALINMVFERLEHGNSFQNVEEFIVALTQTTQDLDISPVVRDIMMNRTFTIISLHFTDFVTDDWVSWFTVKLIPLIPSLTAEMLQTATLNTDCNEYHVIVGALSSVFDQMTLLRHQELAPVLLGYLKQRHASDESNLHYHQSSFCRLCDRRLGFLVHGETDSFPSQLDCRDAPDSNIKHRLHRIPRHVRSAPYLCDRSVTPV